MWPIILNLKFIFTGDLSRIRNDYLNLLVSVAQINTFIGEMIMMLHRRNALTDNELTEMIKHYTQLASPNLNSALQTARQKQNPLTVEEADRLEYYIDKANQGLLFSDSEIDEYYKLVEIAKREQIGEANPWPLIALGGFLLGLALGSQVKRKHQE